MKKTVFIMIAMIGMTAVSCAQSAPAEVQEAYKAKFSNAERVKWEKENSTEWEAEFKLDGKEYSANFSNDGEWKETEHEVSKSDLPSAVKQTLSAEFNGYKVEAAESIETPKFSGYEMELEKGESTMEVVIDAKGKVLKKKVEKEDDDDDED
ncbi:PepSY-like domain-containing protein [Parvicella tangerina]|uniref:Putative beta-lactamase-inhibitor-like PepSY-like domain-containing protein n=1 Tax=Parvicella tangerina TaxID=2829795 RepID=A0A916NHF0_9FLAO|nr:PepSY-like domain-containing protein [Parvicella tangerina]CAG5082863.1 hypothetical protein CRYO30217_02029 [Parvicella tangerina]